MLKATIRSVSALVVGWALGLFAATPTGSAAACFLRYNLNAANQSPVSPRDKTSRLASIVSNSSALDPSFGRAGVAVIQANFERPRACSGLLYPHADAPALALLPAGRIVLAGNGPN
ncbi:MAG TPA: hypothetical protein VES65_04820, partial [Solirubrobacteraceae bacterium]|nr:hypothetical protein [Solirubrobacteraceae bacterium]